MIEHYNAFISYKHAPEDNRVAEAVHKGLERFHIPHRIRKKTGIKRISRIFRDKDELPITSDLSDSIANALADSDYLIVICSTNTKESAWVPREIDCFLQNHSKKDIFTVLVNGEPYDVIPEILKYDETVVKDEDGNERTVRIPTEPLSCDYRMSPGKAKRTELPRLASGIIGCAYDELMNRRRQYRLKQLMAVIGIVLALMAVFCGYMYYSRERIHQNYLESLKNQSKYLANESGNLLEKEQRITALQLALEALPKGEDDDRPVTAEAVRALTDATLAYEGNNGNNINAAWNYHMPGVISSFRLNGDGKAIAIIDEGNVIGLWNTEDHNRILYLDDLDLRVTGMAFLSDSSFAFWDNGTMYCYDTNKGEKIWEYSPKDDSFSSGENMMVTGDVLYIGTYNGDYHKIDTGTGELREKISITKKEGYEDFSLVESRLSPDAKKIAFRGFGGWNDYAYGVLDLGTKNTELSEPTGETVKDIEWLDNDTFMVASTSVDMDGSMSFGSAEFISTDHSTVKCVNAADLSEKWNADFVCNGVMINSGFVMLGKDQVAYFSGNVITVYDIATGDEKYSNNVNDSVIDVSDKDKDGSPTYITANGGYAVPAPDMDADAVYYNKYFTDELRQVAISNGVYARQRYGHEIIYYGVHVYDDEWTELVADPTLPSSMNAFVMDEQCLAILSSDDNGPAIDIYGTDDGTEHFRVSLDGDKVFLYSLLGIYKGRVYIGCENSGSYDMVTVDISTKEVKKDTLFKMATTFKDALSMKDGKLIYLSLTDDVKTILNVYDIDTGENKEIKVPEEAGFISHAPVYYADAGIVCLEGDGEYVADIAAGSVTDSDTPEGWTDACCFSDNCSDGMYAVSDGKSIILSGKDKKIKCTIRCPGMTPLGLTFLDGELVAIYNDGSLFWYSPQSGEMLRNADASVYHGFGGNVIFDHDSENGLLYIGMDKLTDVIDTKSAVEICHVENCFGHIAGRDIFVTSSKNSGEESKVGYYRRYSVNELIAKAHDILKDAQLPDEMRSRYGIE